LVNVREDAKTFVSSRIRYAVLAAMVFFSAGAWATTPDVAFQLDPQQTHITFTLGDVLHTVRGTFQIKQGAFHLNPATGNFTGAIVVDAKSGVSGNGMRDRKMNKEVLESDRYPEVSFRPDHIEGNISLQGTSSVRVHGIFAIHGSDHEVTVPAEVQISGDRWNATMHFTVPYAKWGMKNPSTLFLRVDETVDIDLAASGSVTRP
jgi:polyisoprenoid-binding protein YceI